ncbi:cytochrome b [Nocardioides caricicola]|uniref:Cytochrome b n=1 Tax=Nocardioides caricicola TaxID=634770 RepID=A0ABW0MWR8_9ACTN
MRLRNGEHGYGLVTKTLHWVTVLAVAAQFTVGYLMDDDSGRGRGRGRGEASGHGRGRGGDDDPDLLWVHVALGLTILALALLRVLWRRTALPPWASQLTAGDRRFLHATEVALLTTLFVVPLTGLALVLGDDDLLALHVAAHVAFFAALAAHLTIVLRRRLLPRML